MNIAELEGKRVGLVFSSGFFGFFAHAGCLKAIEELGIKPMGYAGTSSGAIVAAFAAAGMNAQTISNMLFDLKKKDFWDPEPWYRTALSALKLFKGWSGYLEGESFHHLLASKLPVKNFEELSTPCVIVAGNLTRKRKEIFTSGSIADAVQASGTIPWIFKVKKIGEDLFLDGGLVDKAPVEEFARRLNPEVIIVHYIHSKNLKEKGDTFFKKCFSPQKAYTLSMDIARHEHYLAQVKLAQKQGIEVIELKPSLPQVTPDRLKAGKEAFEAAYKYVKNLGDVVD
ncbi:MAG: patatin-like phospholipase family protein [Deltaproteobacteria bacterium]|jgi:NTE family protein|nr:patatin-like phospholipase family protein [Deltaproteobacteria bacterium]